jgi:hypothetical protein
VLLARAHDAQAAGTAPVAVGWVLLEQEGPWGRKALTSSGLDPALGAALDEAAGSDVRVQLVRRPASRSVTVDASTTSSATGRTVVLAHAGTRPWAEQLTLPDDDALAALDPRLAAAPTPPGLGTPVEGPLWLVCTHGKRDRCCATYGRPIVDALAALHGDAVWEVSHVGGHRFAGNLVALPTGEVYGSLQVADALRVVQLHEAGRYDLAALRGRSGLSRPAQAAEILTRTELDLDRRDAVTVTAATGAGSLGEEVTVHLDVDGRRHLAVVVLEPTGVAYALSCDSDEPEDPGRWQLRSLTEVAPG